jgi:hypothetical protein
LLRLGPVVFICVAMNLVALVFASKHLRTVQLLDACIHQSNSKISDLV